MIVALARPRLEKLQPSCDIMASESKSYKKNRRREVQWDQNIRDQNSHTPFLPVGLDPLILDTNN